MRDKIRPIPKGYHSITPYLILKDPIKAIDFYKKAFGAIEIIKLITPERKISYAEIMIGDSKIMLADSSLIFNLKDFAAELNSTVRINLYISEVDKVIEQAVNLGAKLLCQAQDSFYGDRKGMIEDPFGNIWYIATHIENVSVEEIKKRAAEIYGIVK